MFFEGLTSREGRNLSCRDFHLFASLRVATFAGFAIASFKGAKSNQSYFVSASYSIDDYFKRCRKNFVGSLFID